MALILDGLFLFLYGANLFLRARRINDYGPSSLLLMTFFDVFFVLPVFLDVFVANVTYSNYDIIIQAYRSNTVRFAYNAVVLAFGIGFSVFLRQREMASIPQMRIRRWTVRTLLLVSYFPLIFVVLSGKIGQYSTYGGTLANAALTEGEFHNAVAALVAISLVACGILIFAGRRDKRDYSVQLLVLAPAALANLWLLGKRSSIAFLLLFLGMRFLVRARGQIRVRHAAFGIALSGLLLGLSLAYQSALRPDTLVDSRAAYEDFRIDMGRDHDLRLALLPEFVAGTTPILEYRMQSFLFIVALLVPRSYWPDKPFPYSVYVTSAAFGVLPTQLGWGLTTSLISESVSNLGIGGLIPCFCFFVWSVRKLDRTRDPFIFLLGTLSICSLLILNFSAVSVWHFGFLGYLALLGIIAFTRRRKKRR